MHASGRKPFAILIALVLMGLAANPAAAKLPKIGKKNKCAPFQASGSWQGYLHTDEGQQCALPNPVESMKDRDWMFLRFTDYQGPKLRLAIQQVNNRSGYHDVPIDGLEALMGTILFNTQRFVLVERQALGLVMDEQDLGVGDRFAKPTVAKIGVLQGAQYQIFADVVEWVPEKSKIGVGGGKNRYWHRKQAGGSFSKGQAEVAMNFRVVDAATSTVLNTVTTRAISKSWGIGGGGGARGGMFGKLGFSKSAPVSYAVQAAMAKAAYELVYFLTERPWRGAVMDVIDNVVMINAGSDQGIERNMMFTVLHKGRELTDPETGKSLGSRTEVIGTARVTAVEPAFSEAAIVDGCEGVKRGDRVELLADAATSKSRQAQVQRPAGLPEDNPNGRPQAINATPPEEGGTQGNPSIQRNGAASRVSEADTGTPEGSTRPVGDS